MIQPPPVFIPSHGRPYTQLTLSLLNRLHYSGDIYIVLDDLDKEIENYKSQQYNAKILVFDKMKYTRLTDTMDATSRLQLKTVVYARNAILDFAKELGYKYFVMADDDITGLVYRYADAGSLKSKPIQDLNALLSAIAKFLSVSDNLRSASFSGQMAYIGGVGANLFTQGLWPSIYQFIVCKTSDDFSFIGTHNEDYNTVLRDLIRSKLNYSISALSVQSPVRGSNAGGNQVVNEYEADFYSIILRPDSVYMKLKLNSDGSMHAGTCKSVNNTYQKLLSDKYKIK